MSTRIDTKTFDYTPLLGLNTFDGASLQITRPVYVFNETLEWVKKSANAGRKWMVASDEQGPSRVGVLPDSTDPNKDDIRKDVWWVNIMAGGVGAEFYFGESRTNSDRTIEDFRPRSIMWDQSRYALEFFADSNIPFWNMSNANSRLSSFYPNRCLAQSSGDVILIQLVNGGSETIDLTGTPGSMYSVHWFNPFTGGNLTATASITIGNNVPLGNPPYSSARGDWIVVLRRHV